MTAPLQRRLRLSLLKARLRTWLDHPLLPWVALAAVMVGVTAQQVLLLRAGGGTQGNFLCFREAFFRLMRGEDLYAPYPSVNDIYKYSPAFALLFGALAVLPVPLGLLGWNALNGAALWLGLKAVLPPRRALLALAIVGPELLGSIQNGQSNGLVAGLILFAFAGLSRERPAAGALGVVGGGFVKVFPLAGAALGLLFPRRGRFVVACVGWALALTLLPLVAVGPGVLAAEYRSWLHFMAQDARVDHGLSVMGLLFSVLRVPWPSWPVQLAGTLVVLSPLLLQRHRLGEERFRRSFLCSLLVYMVIFNHNAESPSYVIAMAGIAVWFAGEARPSRPQWGLLAFCLLLVSLGTSDLFPRVLQDQVIRRYDLKVLPCLVAWIYLQAELLGLTAARALSESPAQAEERSDPQGVVQLEVGGQLQGER